MTGPTNPTAVVQLQPDWHTVDITTVSGQGPESCGEVGCPPSGEPIRQRVEGHAVPVAAWMRAVADTLDPRPAHRSGVRGEPGGPFNASR